MTAFLAILRFLVDESADARLATYLRSLGFDAATVAEHFRPGLSDDDVLAVARAEGRILVTDDKDFGELVVRHRHSHAGVILLRLGTTTLSAKIARLDYVLNHYAGRLDRLLVVSPHRVRVYPPEEQR
jgi:predicted nuclease of predicted toxin-antitoxin system